MPGTLGAPAFSRSWSNGSCHSRSGEYRYDLELKDREWVEVGTRRILVHHIVDLPVPEESLATCIRRQRPDAVVFGHTHKAIGKRLVGSCISIPVIRVDGGLGWTFSGPPRVPCQ